jgi:hypothetical protein
VVGGNHGSQSLDIAAEAANKGNEALPRGVGALQARHSSGAIAFDSMPQGIKGRQLAAGTSSLGNLGVYACHDSDPGYFRLST